MMSELDELLQKFLASLAAQRSKSTRPLLDELDLPTILDIGILPLMSGKKEPDLIVVNQDRSKRVKMLPVPRFRIATWGLRGDVHAIVHAVLRGPVLQAPCAGDGTSCWAEFKDLWAPLDTVVMMDLGDALHLLVRGRNGANCATAMFLDLDDKAVIARVTVPARLVYVDPGELPEYGFRNLHPKDRREIVKSFADPAVGDEFLGEILVEAAEVFGGFLGTGEPTRHDEAGVEWSKEDGPILIFRWFRHKEGVDPES